MCKLFGLQLVEVRELCMKMNVKLTVFLLTKLLFITGLFQKERNHYISPGKHSFFDVFPPLQILSSTIYGILFE